MALQVELADRGDDAWRRAAAEAEAGRTVVCAPLAVQPLVGRCGGVIYGEERIVDIDAVYEWVASELPNPPPRPSSRLTRLHALKELLTDASLPEELTDLRQRGADDLLAWIDRIEGRADREHGEHTGSDVERGIEHLRTGLAENDCISPPGWRARLARRAKQVRYPTPLVVAPQDLSLPATSGLLKGLGIQQHITVLGLSPNDEAAIAAWLAGARLDATPDASALHPREERRRNDHLEFYEVGDEHGSALALVHEWLKEGVDSSQIAIVCPNGESSLVHLEEPAAAHGIPLVGRASASVATTIAGPLIMALAEGDLGAATETARRIGLDASVVRRLDGVDHPAQRVIATSRLIQRACVESDRGALSPRDLHLAEALLEAGAEALDLDPTPSAQDIVQSASRAMMVGDEGGVAVVSYSEAAAIDRGHLICLGLSDRWPPPLRRTPFARPELLEKAPGLASRDLASEFSGCICAGQRVALMRVGLDRHGRTLSPSPFWIAAKQQAPSAPLRRVAALRRPEPTRVRLTTSQAPLEASKRTSFSVAEIIQFRRCPRGWLAEQTLPREPPTLAQEMGTLSHRALADAFDPQIPLDAGPAERQRRAERLILEREPGQIDDANARVLIARCARVIERYSPPRWPYRTLNVEEHLEYTGKQGDAIKGRLDRIDLGPRGELLIIDYKQHRLPAPRDPSEIADDLQATLYPILARGVLKQRVAGFLFISIDDATHFGIARPGHQIPEGRGIYDERDDNLGAEAAAASAYRAIEGMRSGVIGPARHSPDETCPCQRL